MDCGPACLHMLCRYYGKYVDIERIRRLTGAGRAGISAFDFTAAAEKLQLKCQTFRLTFDEMNKFMPLPCIAHWNGNHFIIVYRIRRARVYVADPAIGLLSYSITEFIAGWFGGNADSDERRGVCIGCEPTVSFKNVISDKRRSNSLEALGYLKAYISPYKQQIWQIVAVLVAVAFLSALVPVITQSVIDSGIPQMDIDFINIMLVASIALGAGIALGTWLQQSITLFFSLRVKVSMMSDYISRLFGMTLDFFESRTIGSMMQRNLDFDRIESIMLTSLFNAVLAILYLLIFGSILAIYDSNIFWVFIVGSLLYILCVLGFWSIRKKMDIRYYTYLAQNQSQWVEFVTKITDVKSYGYGNDERHKWEKIQTGLFKTRIQMMNIDQIQNVVTNLIASIRDALIIYMSAKAVINSTMSVGMMAAVLYIIGQLRAPLANMVNFLVSLQLFYISYNRITDVYKIKTENDEVGTNDMVVSFSYPINVKNLYYKYSTNGDYVLNGLNYSFQNGRITAIVGASGSGKSTLIKVLARLYAPASGSVYIGNIMLDSFSSQTWRKNIGVVTQSSALINDTIANNIFFGRPEDTSKLREAVKLANIRWEIENMPLGYDTMIGENGKGVSEGQKQRILLARALYDDPPILFLDEITSLLDERNEYSIMTSIRNNLEGRTVIIAAHRLGTVKMADSIVVMKSGCIVEYGTHETLASRKREYYNLFKSQLSNDGQERLFARSE